MEPIQYTVKKIAGDYAILVSAEGIENTVALFLLPMEIFEGSELLCEDFSYTLIKKNSK